MSLLSPLTVSASARKVQIDCRDLGNQYVRCLDRRIDNLYHVVCTDATKYWRPFAAGRLDPSGVDQQLITPHH